MRLVPLVVLVLLLSVGCRGPGGRPLPEGWDEHPFAKDIDEGAACLGDAARFGGRYLVRYHEAGGRRLVQILGYGMSLTVADCSLETCDGRSLAGAREPAPSYWNTHGDFNGNAGSFPWLANFSFDPSISLGDAVVRVALENPLSYGPEEPVVNGAATVRLEGVHWVRASTEIAVVRFEIPPP